jgi:ABC-2 type transport system permease protein
VPGGIALLLIAGLIGLSYGRAVIDRQRQAVAEAPQRQAEDHRAVLAPLPRNANAGDQLFYLFFHTVREPSAWAAVAIGQRDVQPFNLKIRLLALQGQLYDADLGSPLLAMLGNFDLAFVLVVLSPLVIIAISYNVWSSERELGTWDLIRSQPVHAAQVLALKFGVRGLAAWVPLVLLQLAATVWLDLPLDARWLSIAAWIFAYVGFWIAASAMVATLQRSSDVNLLLLLGIWILSTVLGPAAINVMAGARFPHPEAFELTVRQRQAYHAAWDRPVSETMTAFYERYPEWRGTPVPVDRYSNAWYYAMNQRGDDAARQAAAQYRQGLIAREQWVGRASWLCPPALFQRALTRVARTDLDAHLAYLDSVAEYHEALKRFFFPAIFGEATVSDVDWASAPRHRYADQ